MPVVKHWDASSTHADRGGAAAWLAGAVADLPVLSGNKRASVKRQPQACPGTRADPPVDIRCKGKFHFDMVQYVASFDHQVDVPRTPQDGPSDQMACETLIVYFGPAHSVRQPRPGADSSQKPAASAAITSGPSNSPNQKMPRSRTAANRSPRHSGRCACSVERFLCPRKSSRL